jgi:hypothetical protein
MNEHQRTAVEAITYLDRCKIEIVMRSPNEPQPQAKLLAEAYLNVMVGRRMRDSVREAAVAIHRCFFEPEY